MPHKLVSNKQSINFGVLSLAQTVYDQESALEACHGHQSWSSAAIQGFTICSLIVKFHLLSYENISLSSQSPNY